MAKKKRPAKKKKKTKKQKQQQEQLLAICVGFALILFAVFGFLKLGFLGILVANGFRVIAGNTYQILCLLVPILSRLLFDRLFLSLHLILANLEDNHTDKNKVTYR